MDDRHTKPDLNCFSEIQSTFTARREFCFSKNVTKVLCSLNILPSNLVNTDSDKLWQSTSLNIPICGMVFNQQIDVKSWFIIETYFKPIYSINQIIRKLHLQCSCGIFQVDEIVEKIRHLYFSIVTFFFRSKYICNHLRRHCGVKIHVFHLTIISEIDWDTDTVTSPIMPFLIAISTIFSIQQR